MEHRVKAIMADIFMVDDSEITVRSAMGDPPQWDSLAQINLIAALEEEFGVVFDVEDFELMTDFPTVIETLSEKM